MEGASEYMLWAKTRQAAAVNLANSGVGPVTRDELPIEPDELDWNGPSYYGWPPLLEALAEHVGVPVSRLCHAEGTSMANHLVLAALLAPGDELLLEDPSYELLADTARYLRAEVRRFPRPRAMGFQPDLDALRPALTPRTRVIALTDLHNPTSARLTPGLVSRIADLAAEVGARVLVDEVYLDAVFDPKVRTAHRSDERIITTGSLTKVYGLNGLRCGWVVADPALIERLWRLTDLFGVIPAHPAERLSLAALRQLPALRERARRRLDENRQYWNAFLAGRPDLEGEPLSYGTVAFPRLRTGQVEALCKLLRTRFETTVAPGWFFGMPDAFRVGLGSTPEVFREGLRRLGEALDQLTTETTNARTQD